MGKIREFELVGEEGELRHLKRSLSTDSEAEPIKKYKAESVSEMSGIEYTVSCGRAMG